jgi:hypothetical protein
VKRQHRASPIGLRRDLSSERKAPCRSRVLPEPRAATGIAARITSGDRVPGRWPILRGQQRPSRIAPAVSRLASSRGTTALLASPPRQRRASRDASPAAKPGSPPGRRAAGPHLEALQEPSLIAPPGPTRISCWGTARSSILPPPTGGGTHRALPSRSWPWRCGRLRSSPLQPQAGVGVATHLQPRRQADREDAMPLARPPPARAQRAHLHSGTRPLGKYVGQPAARDAARLSVLPRPTARGHASRPSVSKLASARAGLRSSPGLPQTTVGLARRISSREARLPRGRGAAAPSARCSTAGVGLAASILNLASGHCPLADPPRRAAGGTHGARRGRRIQAL